MTTAENRLFLAQISTGLLVISGVTPKLPIVPSWCQHEKHTHTHTHTHTQLLGRVTPATPEACCSEEKNTYTHVHTYCCYLLRCL